MRDVQLNKAGRAGGGTPSTALTHSLESTKEGLG